MAVAVEVVVAVVLVTAIVHSSVSLRLGLKNSIGEPLRDCLNLVTHMKGVNSRMVRLAHIDAHAWLQFFMLAAFLLLPRVRVCVCVCAYDGLCDDCFVLWQ